jgi:ribosomal protein S18 acetylase RimI-like enzyme
MTFIRPADLQDCPTLAHLQVDSYRSAYAGILPQEYLDHFTYAEQEQDWRDLLAAGLDDILLVAADEQDQVIGYALGRPGLSDLPPYDSELVSLHVHKDRQGQGAGRALIAAAAQTLSLRGCQSLMLWVLAENRRARALYEQLGGQMIGEKTSLLGEGDIAAREIAYGWEDIHPLCRGEAAEGQAQAR